MTGSGKGKYIHGTGKEEQQRLAKLNHLTNRSFVDYVETRHSDHILELGSGLGILAEMISCKLSTGKVTGIEISSEQLAKCPEENECLSFIQGDVHHLPFKDKSFDTVYCRYILEHVIEPLRVLSEAERVLKPGGRIFIQENSILLLEFHPDCPSFKKVWKSFAEYQTTTGGDAMVGIKLFEMLKLSGFTDAELSMAPELHHYGKDTFDPWIENLIGNINGAKDILIHQGYVTAEEFERALVEMMEFKANEFASTYFYWNRAKASKNRK